MINDNMDYISIYNFTVQTKRVDDICLVHAIVW